MRFCVAAAAVAVLHPSPSIGAQSGSTTPRAELADAPLMSLSGNADSNSPAIWDRVFGRNVFFVMTSINGRPSRASGRSFAQLGRAAEVVVEPWPGGGVWMEAIVKDDAGTWYGYYHNERGDDVPRGR